MAVDTMPALSSIATLTALRKEHIALLTDRSLAGASTGTEAPGSTDLPTAAVARLLRQLLVTARLLEDPDERDTARGMFDYWTAALAGVGDIAGEAAGEWPPFASDWAEQAAAQGDALVADVPEATKTSLGQVLARLLAGRPGIDGPIEAAPVPEPELLSQSPEAERDEIRHLLGALAATGLIRRVEDRSGPTWTFSFRSVARAWPWLLRHCGERHTEELVRDRLLATAELWEQQKGDAGILLSGASLQRATQVLGRSEGDSVEGRFLQASQQRRARTRNWMIGGLLVVVFALVTATVVLNTLRRNAERERDDFKAFLRTTAAAQQSSPAQSDVILKGAIQLANQTISKTKPTQIPLEQLEVRLLICDGSPTQNRTGAKALLALRMPGASGQWRRDYLSQPANASPTYRLVRNEIRYNPEEEDAADSLQKLMRDSLGVEAAKVLTFFPSPQSVSVFFCDGADPQALPQQQGAALGTGLATSEDVEAAPARSPWYAVVASLPYAQAASVPSLAASLKDRLAAKGFTEDVHIYCTRISRSIALTSGAGKSEAEAKIRARGLRTLGLVADAFAQPDRGWAAMPMNAVPDCAGSGVTR